MHHKLTAIRKTNGHASIWRKYTLRKWHTRNLDQVREGMQRKHGKDVDFQTVAKCR